jgi:GNAT superfamily N-acetyltransferase
MNDADLQLKRLTADEVDAVSALARVVWQATYPPLISQAQIDAMLAGRYAPARIRAQLDDPRHAWWVARHKQTLVGFAHAVLDGADVKLDKLYVHPDSQRHGIGAALVQRVDDWMHRQQARRLWLQVNRGNLQAVAAYRKYGFHILESHVFDIGHGFVMDDHVMEKRP